MANCDDSRLTTTATCMTVVVTDLASVYYHTNTGSGSYRKGTVHAVAQTVSSKLSGNAERAAATPQGASATTSKISGTEQIYT